MIREISAEEAIEYRHRLIKRINKALLERRPDKYKYPKNIKLYNVLLNIMSFWDEGVNGDTS